MNIQRYRTHRPSVNAWMCANPEATVLILFVVIGVLGAVMEWL